MIDLHSHILPGIDDGAGDIGVSVEMARVAAADGVRAIAATPHVSDHYPDTVERVPAGVEQVNAAVRDAGVDIEVLGGGEIAITRIPSLDDDALRGLCYGRQQRWLLVESPYTYVTDILEHLVFELQTRGFSVLLAHPERSPCFTRDGSRLTGLVERGVACSITAASLEGGFGRHVRKVSLEMVELGLVHNVASDSHDPERRAPVLSGALAALEEEFERGRDYGAWLTADAPAAIVAGEPLPRRHPPRRRRRGVLSRLRRG